MSGCFPNKHLSERDADYILLFPFLVMCLKKIRSGPTDSRECMILLTIRRYWKVRELWNLCEHYWHRMLPTTTRKRKFETLLGRSQHHRHWLCVHNVRSVMNYALRENQQKKEFTRSLSSKENSQRITITTTTSSQSSYVFVFYR